MRLFLSGIFSSTIFAQLYHGNSDKKTIEIRATEKVSVVAETATVKIGFQNLESNREVVYDTSTRTANKIIQALQSAGVAADSIVTEAISLQREEDRQQTNQPRAAQFSADQEWRIFVQASKAQKVVDVAVSAGANQIGGVDWGVANPQGLEAKAFMMQR